MSGRVFISYARADRGFAIRFRDLLLDLGYGPWLDVEHIGDRTTAARTISNGLKRVDLLAVLLSPNSGAHRYVRFEVMEARRLRLQVLVVRLAPIALPGHLMGFPVVDWRADLNRRAPTSELGVVLHQAVRIGARRRLRNERDEGVQSTSKRGSYDAW